MILGVMYLVGCFGVSFAAVFTGASGWEAAGIAALPVSIASGLGVIVWGNVKEHQAKNGTSQ